MLISVSLPKVSIVLQGTTPSVYARNPVVLEIGSPDPALISPFKPQHKCLSFISFIVTSSTLVIRFHPSLRCSLMFSGPFSSRVMFSS